MHKTLRGKHGAPHRSRTGLWRSLFLSFIAFAAAPLSLWAASFTATLDTDTVTLGESATLTLKFEGGQPRSVSAIPTIENLDISDQGTSQAYNIVNSQISMSVSENLVLTPKQPGEYTIPALTAEINGQKFTTAPLKLKAVKPGTPTGGQLPDQLAFFKLVPSKKEVFVGETFSVEFRVFVRDGVANFEQILEQFDQFGGCPIKAEGFSVLKTAHMQRRQARSGNTTYHVATIICSLTPVKTGSLSIGSMDVPNLLVQIPTGNRRRDMWDPFGMFQQYDNKRLSLTADPETVTALTVPRENAPPNFKGAVGNYTMTVTAGPTNVAVGDPVTVKVQISGHGALDALALPDQPAWRDFKVYPPTSKVETTDTLGLEGTKTFEQVVVPQSAEVSNVPPVSFSYFDSDRKAYRTLSQPAIPISVRPGSAAPAPTVATTSRPAQDKDNAPATQDIVDIKQRMGTLAQVGPPLVQQTWFAALQGTPMLALFAAFVWRRRTDALANNPRLRRQRQVAQLTREKLDELGRLAAENNSEEFFATLFHLLQEQLGERLDLPASAITEAVIQEHLQPRGAPENILTPLQEIFQTCNLARYAPIQSSQELAAIIPKFEALLASLRGLKF